MIMTVNHPQASIDAYPESDLDMYREALTTEPLQVGSKVRLIDKLSFKNDMLGTITYALRATTTGTVIADRTQTEDTRRRGGLSHLNGVTFERQASFPFQEDLQA